MAVPTDLGAHDVGFLLHVIDFSHLVYWTGTSWQWAAGDEGNGYIADFLVTPPTAGWAPCDGTITSILKVGFSTLFAQTLRTPDETSGVYHKSAATTDASVQAAVAATISGNTADESAHTHSVDPPNTTSSGASSATTTGPSTGTTTGPSATETVDNTGLASTVAVASQDHTHDLNHTHDLSHTHDVDIASFASAAGSAHHHGVGTLVNNTAAEPKHVHVMRYVRR